MGDMFVAFINYGDLDLPNPTTTDLFSIPTELYAIILKGYP